MLIIDRFIKQMTETSAKLLKRLGDDPLLRTGVAAEIQAARLADGFVFTEGTMRMLMDKMEHLKETLLELYGPNTKTLSEMTDAALSYRGVWIQFPKPIDECLCLLAFIPSRYLSTGKDNMMLLLLGRDGTPVEEMEYVEGHGFQYHIAMHKCEDCRTERGVPIWCKRCQGKLVAWAQILALSCIIAAQYLAAKRYEEKSSTTMMHMPREKSGKDRKVPLKHVYRVIDANELIIPVVQTDETKRHEERGTWIDGDVVYEEITTRPFTRTYRHPRYVNMQGQTTEFPHGIKRLQPRKVENLGKSVTKVKASLYEKENT